MELWNRGGDLFTNIEKANNVYSVVLKDIPPKFSLAAWSSTGDEAERLTSNLL